MSEPGNHAAPSTARVLAFSVDDGNFCIHLDWVEAVYQRADISLHTLKGADGTPHPFIIHRGQPAWVLDLRQAFDLEPLLGKAERAAFAVIRAGSALWALQVDGCTGVRDLDLSSKVPVPANLLRDGGFPVAHLVDLDGKLNVLLDPSRLPSSSLRDALDPLLKEALAFRDRQAKLNQLTSELRHAPTVSGLKTFGRLSRRNGKSRLATAVKTVLKAVEGEHALNGTVRGDIAAETLLRDVTALAAARVTGELCFQFSGERASVYFDQGRIADAFVNGEWGRGALKEILARREGQYELATSETAIKPQRIDDATLWVLIETIKELHDERRARHLR